MQMEFQFVLQKSKELEYIIQYSGQPTRAQSRIEMRRILREIRFFSCRNTIVITYAFLTRPRTCFCLQNFICWIDVDHGKNGARENGSSYVYRRNDVGQDIDYSEEILLVILCASWSLQFMLR